MPSFPASLSAPLGGDLSDAKIEYLGGAVAQEKKIPTAMMTASPAFGVLGSVVKLDGRGSSDPDGNDLTYRWRFVAVPIGSKVIQEGFRSLDSDGSLSSFSPDVVGEYVVELTVSNGFFESAPVRTPVSIRAIMVPHARGYIPDGKFIWSYIRDVWQQVEGKEWFETLWSALIQIVGSELLKAYQVDFNKSIRDIQDEYQRRWLHYEPELQLDQSSISFILGNYGAGLDASSEVVGSVGEAVFVSDRELLLVSGTVFPDVAGQTIEIRRTVGSGDDGFYDLAGANTTRTGYRLSLDSLFTSWASNRLTSEADVIFEANSKDWDISAIPEPGKGKIRPGDVIHIASGPNAGLYRIEERVDDIVTVNRAPLAASARPVDVFRPVSVKIFRQTQALSDTVAIPYYGDPTISRQVPGRLMVIGGHAMTLLRATVDTSQRIPVTVLTGERSNIPVGLSSQYWSAPHTLISSTQNFEELGVCPGDLLLVDVIHVASGTTAEVRTQVVGVDRNRIGVTFVTDEVAPGTMPGLPEAVVQELVSTFLSGSPIAEEASAYAQSLAFRREYWNREIEAWREFDVLGMKFRVQPKSITRNRLIPVEKDLRSVPLLQEFIVQPTIVERDGKVYQLRNGREYPLRGKPVALTENTDFIIDESIAFSGRSIINTGSRDLYMEDGDFVDRGIGPGDELIIQEPITLAGTYVVEEVVSPKKLRLVREIPYYASGEFVTAKLRIQRRRSGKFIRITPKKFTAANPAPKRLWAEVSFFDNSEAIEKNFGIMVGLTREDLESISTDMNYRQSVAGLMYAYTRGSAIDKIRLGAQILLGLPFAESRGVIRSIEEDYRLDVHGTPIMGRILIEDVDANGDPSGTMRVYTFPVDEESSELSGVDTNPATGKPYAVGDRVELFAPLCKGVKVTDYLTDPNSFGSDISKLQQFHSFRLVANDNVFSLEELSLVSKFLKRITPSYVAYVVATGAEFADTVTVADDRRLKLGLSIGNGVLVDNPSLSLPSPIMYDAMTLSGQRLIQWDDGVKIWDGTGYREVRSMICSGPVATSSASDIVVIDPAGLDFVAPGDWLVLKDGYGLTASRSLITEVTPTGVRTAGGKIEGTDLEYQIFRPGLIQSPSEETYPVTGDGTNRAELDPVMAALADIGDEFMVEGGLRYIILDPASGYVTPPLPPGNYTVRLCKKGRPETPIAWDHLDRNCPIDAAELSISETSPGADCTADSAAVILYTEAAGGALVSVNPASLNILPGDLLAFTSGSNSAVDVGYGPGVYPIVSVDSSQVTLSVKLTTTEMAPWKIIRRA